MVEIFDVYLLDSKFFRHLEIKSELKIIVTFKFLSLSALTLLIVSKVLDYSFLLRLRIVSRQKCQ